MGKAPAKQANTPKQRIKVGNKSALKRIIWKHLKYADAIVTTDEPADDGLRMKALALVPQLSGVYLRLLESESPQVQPMIVLRTNLETDEPPTMETPF